MNINDLINESSITLTTFTYLTIVIRLSRSIYVDPVKAVIASKISYFMTHSRAKTSINIKLMAIVIFQLLHTFLIQKLKLNRVLVHPDGHKPTLESCMNA